MDQHTSTVKSSLAQWLATIAESMAISESGMMVSAPIIVIGALHNTNGELSLNDSEASWLASLLFLVQPIGCVIGSTLQGFIGRKSGMILTNILSLISWFLLYTAHSLYTMYLTVIMMGVCVGFMETPCLSYIGEISEPRIRGMLTSFTMLNVTGGMLIELFLGSIVDWRTATAISAILPVISIILIACIPESPVWLLNKGRREDALEALCWLRGWVPAERVKAEFEQLCCYIETSKLSNIEHSKSTIDAESPITASHEWENDTGIVKPIQSKTSGWKGQTADLFRPSMMRAFRLIIGYQFFFHNAALSGILSYKIEIFNLLKMPVDANWLAFSTSLVGIIGNIGCILLVKYIGKRKLSLFSLTTCSLECIILAVYTLYKDDIKLPWIPMVIFLVSSITICIGIGPIPFMLISEVFPVRGRSFGTGVSAAMFYIMSFFFSKTFLDLKKMITLPGCFFLYGTLGLLGVLFLFIYLPETEGKTLEEIEIFFKKKSKNATSAFDS